MAGLHTYDGAFSTVDANKDEMTGSDECLKAHAQDNGRNSAQCPYAPEENLPMFVKNQI